MNARTYGTMRVDWEQLVVTEDGREIITRFPAEELLIAGGGHYTVSGPLPSVRGAG